MQSLASKSQVLLEPTAEGTFNTPSTTQSQLYDDDREEELSDECRPTSHWYLQVLVVFFMFVHAYTIVMLVLCPLGHSPPSNSTQSDYGADGYGQCPMGGIVPTPWSLTGFQGWDNITLDISSRNGGWWKGVVVFTAFFVSLALFAASYFKASFSDPGYVMHLSKNEEDNLDEHHTYCSLCNIYKPPRCHHCSRCDRCVLKMDHHCIWINNCVGLYNYKHFFQLLCHGLLGTGFVAGLIIWRIVQIYGQSFIQKLPAWQSVILGVSLTFALLQWLGIVYLLRFHVRLVANGRTHVEEVYEYYKKRETNYDQGLRNNCILALGTPILCWLNPCCGITSRDVRRNFDASH